MKLLEVKNSLAKVQFEDTDNLVLSGFLIIEDAKQPYVAQIMSLKCETEGNFAIAKLLFTYDEEGIVKNYNGSIPSMQAEITVLQSKELIDILPVNIPIKFGQLAQQPYDLILDKEVFESNMLICSNNLENTNIMLDNLVRQFETKGVRSVIFDLDGQIKYENKFKFPQDFKLPLNYDLINYIYENDLTDIDPTSKAIIQDIFIEVQEYTKTIEGGFIPFDTFMDVVDAQYRETKISQLILLKNKLLKYRENGVFAQSEKDIKKIEDIVECARNMVIDLSAISIESLQAQIIEYVYQVFNKLNVEVYSFVKVDNSYAQKAFLKVLTTNSNVYTTIIAGHDFKYIKELKSLAKNLVFFAPLTVEHDFASYNTFLNKLNQDEFIVVGDLTQHIPFIVQLDYFDFDEDYQEDDSATEEVGDIQALEGDNSLEAEMNTPDNMISEVQLESELEAELPQNLQEEFEVDVLENDNVAEPIEETVSDDEAEPMLVEEPELVLEEPTLEFSFEEEPLPIVSEEMISEESAPPIIEQAQPKEIFNILDSQEEKDEEINADVELTEQGSFDIVETQEESVIVEDEPSDDVEFDQLIAESESMVEDELPISNEPLDLIQQSLEEDLKSDVIDNDEEDTIPVYPAEETKVKNPIEFEPGETVYHPKYGEGVVEKMVSYGTKKLCSIMFSGNRRRLLDPAISEVKRV